MAPPPEFLALFALSDHHLLVVAYDSCIHFDSTFGEPSSLLLVIRANEIALAKLVLSRIMVEKTLCTNYAPTSPRPIQGLVNGPLFLLVVVAIGRVRLKMTSV